MALLKAEQGELDRSKDRIKELEQELERVKTREKYLAFAKDHTTLGNLMTLVVDNPNHIYSELRIALITETEYKRRKEGYRDTFNIFGPPANAKFLKDAIQDPSIYLIAKEIKDIKFEENSKTAVTIWFILEDGK